MIRRDEETGRIDEGPPSASAGILFLVASCGLFYGFIAVVDPLL